MHYNEFKVVEFARKLIKADEEALENDEEGHDRNACPTSSGKLSKCLFIYLFVFISYET